jgi:hypothetical protein
MPTGLPDSEAQLPRTRRRSRVQGGELGQTFQANAITSIPHADHSEAASDMHDIPIHAPMRTRSRRSLSALRTLHSRDTNVAPLPTTHDPPSISDKPLSTHSSLEVAEDKRTRGFGRRSLSTRLNSISTPEAPLRDHTSDKRQAVDQDLSPKFTLSPTPIVDRRNRAMPRLQLPTSTHTNVSAGTGAGTATTINPTSSTTASVSARSLTDLKSGTGHSNENLRGTSTSTANPDLRSDASNANSTDAGPDVGSTGASTSRLRSAVPVLSRRRSSPLVRRPTQPIQQPQPQPKPQPKPQPQVQTEDLASRQQQRDAPRMNTQQQYVASVVEPTSPAQQQHLVEESAATPVLDAAPTSDTAHAPTSTPTSISSPAHAPAPASPPRTRAEALSAMKQDDTPGMHSYSVLKCCLCDCIIVVVVVYFKLISDFDVDLHLQCCVHANVCLSML